MFYLDQITTQIWIFALAVCVNNLFGGFNKKQFLFKNKSFDKIFVSLLYVCIPSVLMDIKLKRKKW